MLQLRFPIAAFRKNVIFTVHGRAFALYRMAPRPHRFLPPDRKESCVRALEEALAGHSGRGQLLLLWEELAADEGSYLAGALGGGASPFPEEASRHARAARAALAAGARARRRYAAFELPLGAPPGAGLLEALRDAALRIAFAARPLEVPPALAEAALAAEGGLFARLRGAGFERASFADLDFMIRRCADRAGALPPPLPEREGGVLTPALAAAFSDGALLEERLDHVAVAGREGRHFQRFVFLVDWPPRVPAAGLGIFDFPDLGFPFDAAVHFEIVPPHRAAREAESKRRFLEAQVEEAAGAGAAPGLAEEEALRDARVLQARAQAGRPLARAAVCLAVASRDPGEAASRAARLCQRLLALGFRAVVPHARQLDALASFLPGAPAAAPLVECDPGYVAALGPHFASEAGDPRGFLLGWSGQAPVFWSPGRPARELNRTNAAVVAGSLGGGKSVLAKHLAYAALLAGGWVLAADPKGEYLPFARVFGKAVRVVDATPRGGDAFNPLAVSRDEARARAVAADYLTLALNAAGNEPRRLAVFQALERVFRAPPEGRHLAAFGNALLALAREAGHASVREEAAQAAHILRAMRESDVGRKAFGTETAPLFADGVRMAVLDMRELPRPRPGTPPERFTEAERQGVALLYLLAAAAREAAFGLPREAPKLLAFDEAWVLASVPEGERLLDEIVRLGRSYNLIPVLISQNVTDVGSPALLNNVSQFFLFRAEAAEEAAAGLRAVGAAEDPALAAAFARLGPGQCLFRDAEGRIAWLQVDPQPPYLLELFDTRPGAAAPAGP